MEPIQRSHFFSSIKAPLSHPLFYSRLFRLLARSEKANTKEEAAFEIVTDKFEELSRRLDRAEIQESCTVRNVLSTRRLAVALIDEKGEVKQHLLDPLISILKNRLYSLAPSGQYDGPRREHILRVLHALNTDKSLLLLMRKISRPVGNKWADDIIRQTLDLPEIVPITDAHAKQAVLSAWLCYLRQNVGSCFATAPAEIVHDEQPERFLTDMLDLLSTGRLKRIVEGIEYTVPLSASWGNGDLKKPLIVQTGEEGITPELWYSDGLIAAFEAAGYFKPSAGLKEKVDLLKRQIESIAKEESSSAFVITAEEIIRRTLLKFLNLSSAQFKEFEDRPFMPALQMQSSTVITGTKKTGPSLDERCERFRQIFSSAKIAFKIPADNALLKAWEFTLASFSETKYQFSQWNLYSSLGLGTDEPDGIGQCIYRRVKEKLDVANRKIRDLREDYEVIYTQVKTLESRIRGASTEKEMQWLKADYQSRTGELHFLQEQLQTAEGQSQNLVDLYDTLYRLYENRFKDYFQEVYDADMQEITTGPFDDSPAGFRLLYKHGRSHSSQWSLIRNRREFIDALTSFFISTEPQIVYEFEGMKVEKEVSDIVSGIIDLIKTPEFLVGAFHRMAAAHQTQAIRNPLENLDAIEKKPWVYTSGGIMTTLVSCYYRITDKPALKEKWVENETELLVFLADTMKQIPPKLLDPYYNGERKGILMQSPTHAFIFTPFLYPFKETWQNDAFTFTYIRDRFILPAEMFVEGLILDDEAIESLVSELIEKVRPNFRPRFKDLCKQIRGPLNPIFLREKMVDLLTGDPGLRSGNRTVLSPDEIDSLLYSRLPYFPSHELKNRLEIILNMLPGISQSHRERFFDALDRYPLFAPGLSGKIAADQLQNICKSLLCIALNATDSPFDYHYLVSLAAQKSGFAMPAPLIFADTNWVKDLFGFVVNPGTGRLEIWRVDYTGSVGHPMSGWKEWVDGSRSDRKWAVYVRPYEYGPD